jgi:hypothetical protein
MIKIPEMPNLHESLGEFTKRRDLAHKELVLDTLNNKYKDIIGLVMRESNGHADPALVRYHLLKNYRKKSFK